MASMNSREATIALNMLPKIGPVKVRALLQRFGSAEQILNTSIHELTKVLNGKVILISQQSYTRWRIEI